MKKQTYKAPILEIEKIFESDVLTSSTFEQHDDNGHKDDIITSLGNL